MKTMLLAATAALSLGIGSAYAGDGAGPAGGYVYPGTIFPGSVYAGAETPARSVPSAAPVHTYVTHSQSQGVWLYPPNQLGGGGNG